MTSRFRFRTSSALIGAGLVLVLATVAILLIDSSRTTTSDAAADRTASSPEPVVPAPDDGETTTETTVRASERRSSSTTASTAGSETTTTLDRASSSTVVPDEPVLPDRVVVPGLGVASELIELGLNEDRTIEVPEDPMLAGWYKYRPTPGDVGPAVIVGHVDSYRGPGIFYELRTLDVGDEVEVDRSDGTTAVFRVRSVETHSKDTFPTERVYGDTDDAELRLITCGGEFDFETRSYEDNVIVFADLVRTEPRALG